MGRKNKKNQRGAPPFSSVLAKQNFQLPKNNQNGKQPKDKEKEKGTNITSNRLWMSTKIGF
jgi:hypothetical protein